VTLNPQAEELVWKKFRDPNCSLCPLHKEAQTVCLMGDGPVPAKVMLVGEAPGAREDDIQKPFSGVAGQFLDRELLKSGLRREDVYITNSVRCRPPDNRTPTRSELKACSRFLQNELEAVKPEIVVPLGNVALQAILGTSGITKHRGAVVEKNGRKVFATYHPAAILRNPALQGDFTADLNALSRLTKGENEKPKTRTYIIRSSRALSRFLDLLSHVETPIATDVETRSDEERNEGGLQPWAPDGRIDVVGFCWEPGTSYVVALEHPEANWDIPIEMVYKALDVALDGKKLVGHNGKFDLQWLRTKGILSPYLHFDTLLAAHLLDENGSHSLKPLSRTLLGADLYEANVDRGGSNSLTSLAIYNGKDCDYTLRLYHIFREELRKQPRLVRLFKAVVMPAANALVDIELRGFPVDYRRLKDRHREILEKIEETEEKLLEYVPEELKKVRPNFRSPIFLSLWLFGTLGLPILEVGAKSGRPSSRESVLLQLKHRHPAVTLLMELRKWNKYESTYTRNWLYRTSIAGKSRLYTSYNLAGTVTGRLSSNMQQVPRDLYIRSIIGFSKPGWKLIEADFSQVELRIAAMLSGDKELTAAFRRGDDPHLQTAAAVLGKDPSLITKEERKMAKAVNFGFLYGMGWRKFQVYADEKYDVRVTEAEARAYRDAFFRRYQGLPAWHDRQRRIVLSVGNVHSPLGRVRHLPSIESSDEGVIAEAQRQAINSPVQGLASDLTVLSMGILHRELDPNTARVLGNLHDAIILEVREGAVSEVADRVRSVMENLPLDRLFGFRPRVPIKVDVKISSHWGEAD
jgi:uracil-DNA glycosylase family 4